MQLINQQLIDLWQWFEKHQQTVTNWQLLPEYMQVEWLKALDLHIKHYCTQLGYLIQLDNKTQNAELIITAEGNPEYFDHAKALVKAAPSLPGWTITALRKKQSLIAFIPPGFIDVHIPSIQFSILKVDNNYFGVRFFIPGYNHRRSGDYYDFMVDVLINMFGEEEYGYLIPCIDLVQLPYTTTPKGLHPFFQLPRIIDASREEE